MTAEHERRLLARAHELADTEDLAEETAGILGGGRAARLDPDALTSLAATALALGAGSVAVYRAETARFADDRELLEAVEEAEAEIAAGAAAVRDLQSEADSARSAACRELEAARDALDRARAMSVHRPCDGCHPAREAAIAAAQERIKDAQERIAYCDAALEVLSSLARRLAAALAAIRRVPDDLEGTYEPVYDHVRARRLMPRDGDWLTGQEAS